MNANEVDSDVFPILLRQTRDRIWEASKQGPFWQLATSSEGLNPRLYALVLRELYFCIRHATQSLGIGAMLCQTGEYEIARFAYRHAADEVGHEHLIAADLVALGTEPGFLDVDPLLDTQAFIGYTYYLSMHRGARSRLGMTYWAEGSYGNFGSLLTALPSALGLTPSQCTFLTSHAILDVDHFRAVESMIDSTCTTREARDSVMTTLETSLVLFGRVLDGVAEVFRSGSAERIFKQSSGAS
ncbi:iron-containing redox enzyme family protein [Nocardia sp. NPDC056952]|uniref:iron-containing redox enzyme family protein n=1 Tax=Nocardia sp. NPDC056952 TaxID=3345979 RepID=UPI00362A3414